MEAIRVLAPGVRDGRGTIAIPYIYTGKTVIRLQELIAEGVWMLGYKLDKSTDDNNTFDIFWEQLEVLQKLGWITDVNWIQPYLCTFFVNSGHFHRQLELMVAQLKGWFLYCPAATWKPVVQPQ